MGGSGRCSGMGGTTKAVQAVPCPHPTHPTHLTALLSQVHGHGGYVPSGVCMFVPTWGLKGGGGTCCLGEGEGGPCLVSPLPIEEGGRGLLIGVAVLRIGVFGHLLLLPHISQSVLGIVSCCLLA